MVIGGNNGGGGGVANLSEDFKHFDGDGSTTDFDCETSLDVAFVDIDGYTMSDNDYSKDDTVIKFNEAPENGAEITVHLVKGD